MTTSKLMDKKVSHYKRRNKVKVQPVILYKKTKLRKPSMQLDTNQTEKMVIHKTVYLPDFEEYENFRPIDYKEIHSLLN